MLRAPARQAVTSLQPVLGDRLGNKVLLPQLPSPSKVIYELFHSSALEAQSLPAVVSQRAGVKCQRRERGRCLISATEVSEVGYGFSWKPCGVAGLNDCSCEAQLGDSHSCSPALDLPEDGD